MKKTTLARKLAATVAALIIVVAASCSKPDHFTVRVTIADGSEAELALKWFDGTAMHTVSGRAIEGRANIPGSAPSPAMAWITDGTGRVVTSFIVADGDKIKVKADLAEPLRSEVSGSDDAEEFAAWSADNAVALTRGDAGEINDAVTRYVAANPGSRVSAALIAWVFRADGHELQADSLMRLLKPEARSRAILGRFPDMIASQLSVDANGIIQSQSYPVPGGRTERLYPRESSYSLIAFTSGTSERSDAMSPLFRRLSERYDKKRLRILEVSGAPDSAEWARYTAADTTASWTRTWSPTAIADRRWRQYAVPALPFFIVADSTGSQVLRSRSADETEKFITGRLH